MSIGYTWEKLYGAVLALVHSDNTLQDRVASAYRAMHMLTPEDFPDEELQEKYARLVHALPPREPGGLEGSVAPSLALLSPDQARAMAQMIPGARLAVIPGAGHIPPVEQPAATTDALREFLRSLG